MSNIYMYYLICLLFLLTYIFTKQYDLSLFFSLIVLFLITIFNYNPVYLVLPFIIGLGVFLFSIKITKYVNFLNFSLLIYIFLSIIEFTAHKFFMHCEKDSMLKNLFENIPIIYDRILIESSSHINHHLEVETDMTLKHIDDDNSLFMSWNNYILFFFFFLSSVFISKFITNYPISYTYIFLLGIIITFLYEYIWNKTHHTMHEYDKGYSILRGPYDEDIFDLDPIKNILYMNHLRHHLQKGEKKGNYNVILLGADEWFGYNNKTIDNTEYCKTHPHEKICQICE